MNLKSVFRTIEDLEPANARHGLHLTSGLVRLAWAVRALHGNPGRIDRVDASFITKELCGEDCTEPGVERTLPGGIGTVVIAARLLQAGGGRIVSINGNGAKGHDVHWVTAREDTVFVERKDRSYEAGLDDTMEKRCRRVVNEVRRAAETMPMVPATAARILVIGFSHLVRPNEMADVDGAYQKALIEAFGAGATELERAPHLVLIEHLGFEAKAGGAKSNFFSPQLLRKSHAFLNRVAPLVVNALGVRRLVD